MYKDQRGMKRVYVAHKIAQKLVGNLSAQQRNDLLLNVWYSLDQQDIDEGFDLTQLPFDRVIVDYFIRNEFDEEVNYGEFFDPVIIEALASGYLIYNNTKLQQMYDDIYQIKICIDEDSRRFHLVCPCCGFYSLSLVPDWEVCGICMWENDGEMEEKYSVVNRMSLMAYRQHFYEKNSKDELKKHYISDASI